MSTGRVERAHERAHPDTSRMFRVVHYVTYVGIPAHAAFIPLFAWLGVPRMALFNAASVAAWLVARVVNRRGMLRLAVWIIFVEVISHAVLAVTALGWDSGFHYYLIPLIPFLLFNDRLSLRTAVTGSVGVAVVYAALRAGVLDVTPTAIPSAVRHAVEYMNIAVPLCALAVISAYFRTGSLNVERHMATLAMTDTLTALPNRRSMRDRLEDESVRFARDGRPFAIVLGDIDDFKRVNDTAGHQAGDRVLRELAMILRATLRKQDTVARWGGEEFMFLLPDTDLQGAAVASEKLRAAVAQAQIEGTKGLPTITMTFGVAAMAVGGSFDDAIRRADSALYAGKKRGKNCVLLESNVPADAEPTTAASTATTAV